jgi:8-oxo-dGTP diphosphatase
MKKIVDTVLVFLVVEDASGQHLLMIEKTSGQGAGKLNVPGGKREHPESALDAARRELLEETGVALDESDWEPRGELLFEFEDTKRDWNNRCEIFFRRIRGRKPKTFVEGEEGRVFWVQVNELPLTRMWASDREWVPAVMNGKNVQGHYVFAPDHQLARADLKTFDVDSQR